MIEITATDNETIRRMVTLAVTETKVVDMHTHVYDPAFGSLLLWGIDDLLVYHYLVSETMRWVDMPYDDFWAMSKREQADLVWKTLFLDHSPISEACRGVLTILESMGLNVSSRNLDDYRAFFDGYKTEDYVDKALDVARVESVVMTNDPFDDQERPVWLQGYSRDSRFHAALRLDTLLNSWEKAVPVLKGWGYDVHEHFIANTISEVQRFLRDWIERIDALYMAVSLPPSFAFPEDSPRGKLIEHCILPVAHDKDIPFAMMIGVKKLVNPSLRLAGDSVGKGNIDVVEYFCANYPENKFLVTMLARENQHEICVAARKFRNLMVFGCWWFLNIPITVEEMTRLRLELLGESMIPQHSDARVLDQVIYKWDHSRTIIADVLTEKYTQIAQTGWVVTEEEIRRDVADMFGRNFWRFLGRE